MYILNIKECYSTNNCIFETGARHPFAQVRHFIHTRIAFIFFCKAVGKNIANPTAMLLTSANMLDHMSMNQHGDRIRKAVMKTVRVS